MFDSRERSIIRELAAKVREISELPVNANRRTRWFEHNSLSSRLPMILCNPEGAWGELITGRDLICANPTLRSWEWHLRMRIYQFEILADDAVVEPYFDIPWIIEAGNYGVETPKTFGEKRGSYTWAPALKSIDEAPQKLTFRKPVIDRERTHEFVEQAREVVGEHLEVRIQGQYWWTMGLTWPAIDLIGLEGLMWAMVDTPDPLHALMAWLRDEHLNFILWFEQNGLLSSNVREQGVASGGLGYTNDLPLSLNGDPVKLQNMWGFAESQETVGISPEMFAEFVLPYQIPLLEKFGLNSYGCCEPIHNRWKHIKSIPRLRRLSVSPWCDQELMAEELKRDYIFSRKPNPALVCVEFDEETVRKDLRKTLEIAGDCVLEIILKDTHTVQGKPDRLKRWVEIAREEVEKHFGYGSE